MVVSRGIATAKPATVQKPALSPTLAATAVLAYFTISVAAAVVFAMRRGPWLDEFYSIWFSDPTVPLAQAFTQRWLIDSNPPLFSALSRAFAGLTGQDYELRRLLNLIPLGAFVSFWFYLFLRRASERVLLAVYLVLMSSSGFFLTYFAEDRSYFSLLCFGATLSLGLYCLTAEMSMRREDAAVVWAVVSISLFMLVNLHYLSAAFALILAACAGTQMLFEGRRRDLLLLGVAAFLPILPLACFFIAQEGLILSRTGGNYWIKTSEHGAIRVLARFIQAGVGGNVVAALAAACVLWASLGRPPWFPPLVGRNVSAIYRRIRGAAIFAASVAGFLFLLFIVNIQTPIVVDRYFIVSIGSLNLAVAMLSADVISRHRWIFLAFLANAVLFLGYNIIKQMPEFDRWNATARLVAENTKTRPGTKVFAFQLLRDRSQITEEGTEVMRLGYGYLAVQNGFAVAFVDDIGKFGSIGPGTGPTLLWFEHVPAERLAPAVDARAFMSAANIRIDPAVARDAALERGVSGVVIVIPGTNKTPSR
jgi:hypothetical protein